MEKVIDFLNKIKEEFGYEFLFQSETKEVWLTGYKNEIKFDLHIRPEKDGKYKFNFEIPFERKVCLFLNEDDTVERIRKIFYEDYYFENIKKKETESIQNKM